MKDFDLVVVGAGIVGTASALWAQKHGLKVLLCDPNLPGSGTSYGNACTIATYAVTPLNSPALLRGLPQLMLGKGPLFIHYPYAICHPLWMLSFLSNCRQHRSDYIAQKLVDIMRHAESGLHPLVTEARAEDLVINRGQLSVWSSKSAAKNDKVGVAFRKSQGISLLELSPQETMELEPGLQRPTHSAVYYPKAQSIHNPQELITRMHHRFIALGGQWRQVQVAKTRAHAGGVEVTAGHDCITTARVVIAAGAHSKLVEGSGAERLPLGVERGYHLVFSGEGSRISRPVCWVESGFYATPMAQGLRLAGLVEIASLHKRENNRCLRYLANKGQEMLGTLPKPDTHWLGFRPTMPDSLPVIGHAKHSKRIMYAFGHQHIGLTLGGITGKIIAELAEGRQPSIPIKPFSPDRRYC